MKIRITMLGNAWQYKKAPEFDPQLAELEVQPHWLLWIFSEAFGLLTEGVPISGMLANAGHLFPVQKPR